MSDPNDERPEDPEDMERRRVGLCYDCRHTRCVRSARGQSFYQCGLARQGGPYPAYPPIPVQRCPGYEGRDPTPEP